MKAKDIMTTEIATLPLQCTVGWALRECARKKFQAFPVVDQEGRLQGILSIMMIFQSILPSGRGPSKTCRAPQPANRRDHENRSPNGVT